MYRCKNKKEENGISATYKPFLCIQDSRLGITLVALVVTIVVLLILAGITITMLFSENGIIRKAQEAADKTADDKVNTEQGLSNLKNQMLGALGEKETIPTTKQGEKVPTNTLYANFVAKTDDNKDINVPVPGGYTVVENTEKSDKINDGIVIQDMLENQFVWVPVNDEQLTRMYDATNKRGNLYDFGSNSAPENPPTLIEYSSEGYREPDILTDTVYGDASTTSGRGIENLRDVIGIEADNGVKDENQNILDKWKNELQKSFDNMIKSVEIYKGFYIGRYETGSLSKTENTNIPEVQKGKTVGGADWHYQYAETRNLRKMKDTSDNYVDNPNVTTSMIWGCQVDRTLEWIAQTNLTEDGKPNYGLLTDSSSWGNYNNYKTVTGDKSTASGGINNPQPSGTNPNWQKNNIYDLAGNAWDRTIEVYKNNNHVLRGGVYNFPGDRYSAFSRANNNPTTIINDFGSRSTLLINTSASSNTP